LYQSLTDPGAVVVSGFSPIMPDTRRQLSIDQIWAIIAFLQSQGGEVTVTEADIQENAPVGPAPAAPKLSSVTDPLQLLNDNACMGCHALEGTGGAVGPSFDGIGDRLDVAGIRKAILDPGADVSEGYEQFAGVMPTSFGDQLSAAQLEIVVIFLAARR
jgi:cytochrome c551/c552